MIVNCPHCSGAIDCTPEFYGVETTCPHCGNAILMPEAPRAATPAAAPAAPVPTPVQAPRQPECLIGSSANIPAAAWSVRGAGVL